MSKLLKETQTFIHSFIHSKFIFHIKYKNKTRIFLKNKIQYKWYRGCDQAAKRPDVITPQYKKKVQKTLYGKQINRLKKTKKIYAYNKMKQKSHKDRLMHSINN